MKKKKKSEVISIEEQSVMIEKEEVIVMNELIPIGYQVNDDMKKIADMIDEFSQTIDPILRIYNAAMNATTARLDVIEDEFKFRKVRNPIHHIDTRLKSANSILGKLENKQLHLSLAEACNNIYDIAGVRVVCPYIKDVYLIKDRIMAQDDITVLDIKDYIKHPKANGYRSLHIVIRVPVYFMNKKQLIPVEIQIRTLAMDLWASLEHDIMYKSINKQARVDFSDRLLQCSRLIYQAEAEMELMNEILEDREI